MACSAGGGGGPAAAARSTGRRGRRAGRITTYQPESKGVADHVDPHTDRGAANPERAPVTAVSPAGRVRARHPLLIAVGSQACEAAAADPRGHGKELVQAARWQDIPDLLADGGQAGSALVVVPGDQLTYAAVESLLAASVRSRVPVGVLPAGRDGQVLGAGRPKGPPARHAGMMYCHFRNRFGCDAEYGREESEAFLTRLAGGVEAAVFHAHGNGADLQLGPHVVCVQADDLRGKPRPGDLTLPCQAGGPCRLAHLPIEAYWGAATIRARIVVLVTCWGYHPADGVISPEVLLGTALFRGPAVEAFVASTRVTYNTPEVTQAALAFLEMGGTAGELTLLLNQFPGTATPAYVCIGDPDVRVQAPGGGYARHACTADGNAAQPPQAPATGGAGFDELVRLESQSRQGLPGQARSEILAGFGPVLKDGRPARVTGQTRALVAQAWAARAGGETVTVPSPARRYRAFTALAARHTGNLPAEEADAFWDLVHRDPPEAELDERWCQILAALLRVRGPEQLGYLSAGSVYRDERLDTEHGRDRHLCGNRMFRITVEFAVLDGYRRELSFCERCGPVADVPAGMPAPVLAPGDGGMRVLDSPWPDAWMTAGVVPCGPSLWAASAPRRMRLSEPIPVPPGVGQGRRFGAALVAGGDHVLMETELPPEETRS